MTSKKPGLSHVLSGLIIFVASLSLGSIFTTAAASPMDQLLDDANFAQDWNYKMIASVLKQLRGVAKRQQNMELVGILSKVRIAVPKRSMVSTSPNAFAFSDDNKGDWIIIEDRWLRQVAGFAELGALFAFIEADWDLRDQFQGLYEDHCRNFQYQFRNQSGTSAIVYQFKIEDYYRRNDSRHDAFLMMYDKVAAIAFFNTIVWTVLHEMGHHTLGHTTTPAASREQMRDGEFAADRWAFSRMEELGYSLYPVTAYFLARMWADDCFKGVGLIAIDAQSTHPTWLNRGEALFGNFDWHNASNQQIRVFFIPGNFGADAKAAYTTLTIHDRSKGMPQATMIQFGHTREGIVEWSDNQATVYVRGAGGGRFELTIKRPYEVMTIIEQREYDVLNRHVGTVPLQAVQQDSATFDFLTVNALNVSDIRARADSGDTWKRHLRALGVSESVSKQARATRDQYVAERYQITARYMKGQTMSLDFEHEFTDWGARYGTALDAVLGVNTHQELRKAVIREVNSFSPNLFEQDLEWERRLLKENLGQ